MANMSSRQLRRLEERRLRKRAAKEEKQSEALASGAPDPAIVSRFSATRRLRKQDHKASNQANAQKSTGPKTPEGKAVSSRNAVRHGLTGTFCVLPGEDGDAYLLLHAELLCEHDPVTATEELLVSDMVRHYWLTQRAMRLQEEVMTRDFNEELVMKQLALFIRYQTTNQRAFHKCMADLLKLQKERRKREEELAELESGFVSQTPTVARAAAAQPYAETGETGFVSQNQTEQYAPQTPATGELAS